MIRVIDYTPDMRSDWDALVEASENGTIFHRMDFLDYHPADRFTRCDVLAEIKGRFVAAMPLARYGHRAESPFGGSFGGPACLRMGAVKTVSVLEALQGHLAAKGIRELAVSMPPPCYCKRLDCSMEYCFMRAARRVSLHTTRVTSVLDLERCPGASENIRRNIRKALDSGVTFHRAESVNDFHALLASTLQGKHGATSTHSSRELGFLVKHLPEMVTIHLASWQGQIVAGTCTFSNASPCAFLFYNCHDKDKAPPGALAALVMHVAQKMREEGKRFLDLGATSMLGKPMNQGLFQFKEGLGAQLWFRNTHVLGLE